MSGRIPTDPARAAALARDPATPAILLAELAKSDLTFLREAVARHPNATPDLLESLIPTTLETDTARRIALAIVSNPKTPDVVLTALLQRIKPDRVNGSQRENKLWEDLTAQLLLHPNCPGTEAIAFLQSKSLSRKLKIRIAEGALAEELLNQLLEDASGCVRDIAATRLSNADHL